MQGKIRELEDTLGEYEEENMKLQNQLYEQKVEASQKVTGANQIETMSAGLPTE